MKNVNEILYKTQHSSDLANRNEKQSRVGTYYSKQVTPSSKSSPTCLLHTENFNGYLVLSNFSNFTTNTHGTPNTHFFMGTMVQIAPHQLHVFLPFNFEKRQLPIFFFPILKKNMKKRVLGVPCVFVVKLEKLDNAKYPLKLSVHEQTTIHRSIESKSLREFV